jgi:hypothetical protein
VGSVEFGSRYFRWCGPGTGHCCDLGDCGRVALLDRAPAPSLLAGPYCFSARHQMKCSAIDGVDLEVPHDTLCESNLLNAEFSRLRFGCGACDDPGY